MKPIKYFLLFVTALCVSQWNNWGREPQRGFGPRIPNNQNKRFGPSFSNNPNNGFESRFLNQQNKGFGPRFSNKPNNGFGPRFSNQQNKGFGPRFPNYPNNGFGPRFPYPNEEPRFKPPQNQITYLQPQENQLNLNNQPEQAPEAQFQVFGTMNFNGQQFQLPEQQLQTLFNPLFEQLERIEHKLNNNEQLTEQQIFNLLILMPDLVDLQPIFKELTDLLQKPQEVQKQQFQQAFQQLKEVQSQVGQPL